MKVLNLPIQYAVASLFFGAYCIMAAQTDLKNTSMMFVFPILILIAVHGLGIWLQKRQLNGLVPKTMSATLKNGVVLLAIAFFGQAVLPMPSAAGGGVADYVYITVVCVLIVLAVVVFIAVVVNALVSFIVFILRLTDRNSGRDKYEFASLGTVALLVLVMSFEGVPGGFHFERDGIAVASRSIEASPQRVWETLETATQPSFQRPVLTSMLPQPIEVRVDEGVELGANRVVHFMGRTGSGDLRLQVVERTDTMARFEVLEDAGPIAMWVDFKGLSYSVYPDGGGTRLEVSLSFDRKLSPAWIFDPMIEFAGALAMDTLARDVRERAQAPVTTVSNDEVGVVGEAGLEPATVR